MPKLICQCGCGETIPARPHHSYYQPRYIQSHFLRISLTARMEKIRQTKEKNRLKPPADWPIPSGLCECGCGKPTKVAKSTNIDRDQYAGYPNRYIQGHSANGCGKGALHNTWKGGRFKHRTGYIYVYKPDHPRANACGYVPEHRLIYESAHGIQLTHNDVVHHVNGVKDDNRIENLVLTTKAAHAKEHDKLGAYRAETPVQAAEHRKAAGRKGAAVRWGKA